MDDRQNVIARYLQRRLLPSLITRAVWRLRWTYQRHSRFVDEVGGYLAFPLAGLALSLFAVAQYPALVQAIATFPMM